GEALCERPGIPGQSPVVHVAQVLERVLASLEVAAERAPRVLRRPRSPRAVDRIDQFLAKLGPSLFRNLHFALQQKARLRLDLVPVRVDHSASQHDEYQPRIDEQTQADRERCWSAQRDDTHRDEQEGHTENPRIARAEYPRHLHARRNAEKLTDTSCPALHGEHRWEAHKHGDSEQVSGYAS